jgi:hypothetical protein
MNVYVYNTLGGNVFIKGKMAERSKAPDSSLSFRVDHHTEYSGLARGGGSNPPLVSFFCLFIFTR